MEHRVIRVRNLALEMLYIGFGLLCIALIQYAYAFTRSLKGEMYDLRYTDAWRTMGHRGWVSMLCGSVLLSMGIQLLKDISLEWTEAPQVLMRSVLIFFAWGVAMTLIVAL